LKSANKWLQDTAVSQNAKTKEEAAILIKEIELFQQRLNQPAEENEGAIARLYHRSTALVEREVQHALKNWDEASTANATLKQLVDARLHFHYAEHELFVSHDAKGTTKELTKTIAYLDRANITALPHVKQKIVAVKTEIQKLAGSNSNDADIDAGQQKITQALDTAQAALQQASEGVTTSEIKNKLKTITNELKSLKKEISSLENKQHYHEIMNALTQLSVSE
jgi:hypothetical protein